MTKQTKVQMPFVPRETWSTWHDNDGRSGPRCVIEWDYKVLLKHGLIPEHERLMRGLVLVRDAIADMQRQIVPPRMVPEEDAAMLARVGLPFELEVVS